MENVQQLMTSKACRRTDQKCRPANRGIHGYRCWDLDSRLVDYWGNFCLLTFTATPLWTTSHRFCQNQFPETEHLGNFPYVALILMDVDAFSSLRKGCGAGESLNLCSINPAFVRRRAFVTRCLFTKEDHSCGSSFKNCWTPFFFALVRNIFNLWNNIYYYCSFWLYYI